LPDRKVYNVVAAVIERDGRYLITQRMAKAVFPLYWEFPGGKVEAGEDDATALRREMLEELAADVEVEGAVDHTRHDYAEFTVDFRVYRCRLLNEDIRPLNVADFRWVSPDEFKDFRFPPADDAAIAALAEERFSAPGGGKGQ